jgi:hypothetical protein
MRLPGSDGGRSLTLSVGDLRMRFSMPKKLTHLSPTQRAKFALAMLIAVAADSTLAHGPNQAPHQLYKMGDLKLESGETIRDFSISYVTHGRLNAKKSNAILMVTAISGNHHRLDFLIGPGKALVDRL